MINMPFSLKHRNTNQYYIYLLPLVLCLSVCAWLVFGCTNRQPKWRIGVSQCSEDVWRYKQNYELQLSQYVDPRIDLNIFSADNDDKRQIEQIEQLLQEGIDLLIVAPNRAEALSKAIDKAYDQGIPVILFDRKTDSDKYTAFMGADNYKLGKTMGHYIARQMEGKGTLVEITGLRGSSPATERHRGFTEALQEYPEIALISSQQSDWTEESGYLAMQQLLADHQGKQIDCLFGHNDRLALGARRAAQEAGLTEIRYYGVDALPTPGGGMEHVQQGTLEASYIYPTRGLQLMKLATDILSGQPYEKKTTLFSTIVDRQNVDILLAQYQEQQSVTGELEHAKNQINEYFLQIRYQHRVIIVFVIVITLIIVLAIISYQFYATKLHLNNEMVEEIMAGVVVKKEEQAATAPQAQALIASLNAPEAVSAGSTTFLDRFRSLLQNHLHDPDFNVERMGEEIGMSRAQLYRKIKALTGQSPVELLRKARLARGLHLLLTTDKTIAEIAYEVGFSAPSYFTKCFKEEFEKSPGDIRQTQKEAT